MLAIAHDYETAAGTGGVRTEGNSYNLYQRFVWAVREGLMSDLRQQLCVPADTDEDTRKEIAPLKDSEDWRSMRYCSSWGGSDSAWQQVGGLGSSWRMLLEGAQKGSSLWRTALCCLRARRR